MGTHYITNERVDLVTLLLQASPVILLQSEYFFFFGEITFIHPSNEPFYILFRHAAISHCNT